MLNIVYSAIKLDNESKEKILHLFNAKYQKVFADHLTLKFGSTHILPKCFGEEVELQVLRYVFNEKCQALECKILNKNVVCDNVHPHITISTTEDTKPVYSNDLLNLPENDVTSVNVFKQNIMLTGKVGVYTQEKQWLFKV